MNSGSPLLNFFGSALLWAWGELREWASPLTNPFVAQARAQEAHRPTLWRALWVITALWCALMFIVTIIAGGEARDAASDAALGWIGSALLVMLGTRFARCIGLLRVEVLKNRFEPLQLLPLESARRAWLWCAPVSLFSLSIGALALPALAWELGAHQMAWPDMIGVGFVALVFGWGTPLWRPHVWRAQINKAGARNASQSDGFIDAPPLSAKTTFVSNGALLVSALVTTALLVAVTVGTKFSDSALAIYWQSLPAYVRATGEEWWLSWPLFLARWLTEAQPFFGFALPPIVLLGPVWVAGVHNAVLRLGAVTALEPHWTPQRQINWWRAGRVQVWGLMAFVCGIAWANALRGEWLSEWFFGAPRTTAWTLAVWWLVALGVGVFNAASHWKQALAHPTQRAPLARQIPLALREAARPPGWALALFVVSCALGLVWPFGAPWRQMLPASLAVAATWLGASLVTSAGQRIPRFQKSFVWLSRAWFYGGPLLFLALNFFPLNLPFWTDQLNLLSPWMLWWILRQPAIVHDSAFWLTIVGHFALIAACSVVVWRARNTVIGEAAPEHAATSKDLWTTSDAVADTKPESPLISAHIYAQIQADEEDDNADYAPAAVSVLGRPLLSAPDDWLGRVLNWQSRFDNPLLLLETRRVIGLGLGDTLRLAKALCGALAVILLMILPVWGLFAGAFPAEFVAFLLAISLLIWCVVPLNGIEGISRCYDHDRVDGSLQMLFLTPLTEREIALGKVGPFVSHAALLLAFYSPLWLMGLVPALIFHEPIIVAVYLMAPLFTASFALRIAAVPHWTALKKRVIGTVSVPWIIVLGAIFSVPAELMALFVGMDGGALSLALILLGLTLVFVAEAALFWWLSLRQLRWRRGLDAPVGR